MARIRAEGGGRRVGAVRKRERRRWTVAEKVRIVREMARTGAGMREIGRRHGAHVSMLKRWRAQYRAGEFDARQAMTGRARLVPGGRLNVTGNYAASGLCDSSVQS